MTCVLNVNFKRFLNFFSSFVTMSSIKMNKKGKPMKKMVRITIDMKKEIVNMYERGMRIRDLALAYHMPRTSISTIVKNKEAIKAANVAKGVKSISKQRSETLEHVEKVLLLWISEQQCAGESVTEAIICRKAKAVHTDLLRQKAGTSQVNEVFKASHGWFDNFKKRTGILRSAEKETDHYAIPECPNIVQNIIEEHNNYKEYYHDQFEVTEEEEQKHNISNTPTLQESSFERLHDSDNCDLNENSKVNEERYDVFGKTVAIKLKEIRNNKQRLLAEKLINDTLFLAELGELTSVHCIIENNSQVNHFLMSHVNNSSDSSNLNHIDDNKLSEVYIKEEIEDS